MIGLFGDQRINEICKHLHRIKICFECWFTQKFKQWTHTGKESKLKSWLVKATMMMNGSEYETEHFWLCKYYTLCKKGNAVKGDMWKKLLSELYDGMNRKPTSYLR